MAFEERSADLGFKSTNAVGDVRLHRLELTGGARDAAASCNGCEGLQVRQLHAYHRSKIGNATICSNRFSGTLPHHSLAVDLNSVGRYAMAISNALTGLLGVEHP